MAGSRRKLILTHIFKGDRFEDHGVDIEAFADLITFKDLLVETAKSLYRSKHPERKKLPANFESALILKVFEIGKGSAAIPIEREYETPGTLPFPRLTDEFDEAAELLVDTIELVRKDNIFPDDLPKNVIPLFKDYGKTLRAGERIEIRLPSGKPPAHYSSVVKQRFLELAEKGYEDFVDEIGRIEMVRVNRPKLGLVLRSGREIEVDFRPEDEDKATTGLRERERYKLRIIGKGRFSPDGNIQRIFEVRSVDLLSGDTPLYDENIKPVEEAILDIIKNVPDEVFEGLPVDGAAELDHYVYGSPKRNGK